MTIKIGNSSIKRIQLGNTEVKSAYLGNALVYGNDNEGPLPLGPDYACNIFVFDTSLSQETATVKLKDIYMTGEEYARGTITDWGDGTLDAETSHTYSTAGVYTVRTRHVINSTSGIGDSNTRKMLIECLNVKYNIYTLSHLFYDCVNLVSVDLSTFKEKGIYLDYDDSYSAYNAFNGCESLESIDLSGLVFNDIDEMLNGCINLKSVNLNNIDISRVTSLNYVFRMCRSLINLDVSSFDTVNVTDMCGTFEECYLLTKLDISNFNTRKVTRMVRMFAYCKSLTKLNISNFNTINVTNTSQMFTGSNKLTLDNITMTNCDNSTKTKITEAFNAA